MTKMLIAVIALSVLGYLAYRTMYGSGASVDPEVPTQRLENVQNKANELEKNSQQHVDDVEKKMQE